jgi:hypothetical protein
MSDREGTRQTTPGNGHQAADDATRAAAQAEARGAQLDVTEGAELPRGDGTRSTAAADRAPAAALPEPLGRPRPTARHRALGARLAATGMLAFPALAGVAALMLFLANNSWHGVLNESAGRALASGAAIGAVISILLAVALRDMSSAHGAVPTAFAQLDQQLSHLRLRFDRVLAESGADAPPTLHEARAAIEDAEERLRGRPDGADWLTAIGYVDVWRRLHRADEALLAASVPEELVAGAGRDYLRVKGSTIPQAVAIAKLIDEAANVFHPGALEQFGGAPRRGRRPGSSEQQAIARAHLRQARRAIDDFRDASRMGLVRARNALVLTIGATGILAYLLFALAMLAPATPAQAAASRAQIATGAAYWVVAGLVGLFRQLQLASARDTVSQEDFGLQAVRLIHTPLFSGIAGVAGVVLTKLVTDAASIDVASVFDIHQNRLGFVVAAVFGLAPGLLVSQLHAKAESYKTDLKNTEAGQGVMHALPDDPRN